MTAITRNRPQPTHFRDQNSHVPATPVRNGRWSVIQEAFDGISIWILFIQTVLVGGTPLACSASPSPIDASLTYPLAALSVVAIARCAFLMAKEELSTSDPFGSAALITSVYHGVFAAFQSWQRWMFLEDAKERVKDASYNLITIYLATTVISGYVAFKALHKKE